MNWGRGHYSTQYGGLDGLQAEKWAKVKMVKNT